MGRNSGVGRLGGMERLSDVGMYSGVRKLGEGGRLG